MFLLVRRRLGYVNVVVTLVLVFAVTGGAYAAGKYVITSAKQIKPSVLKQLQGKGRVGPAGPAGPVGAAGRVGAVGSVGAVGAQGPAGLQGPVGLQGATGEPGSPCTVSCSLPSGKTLRGDWVIEADVPGTGALEGSASTAVSFSIPLVAAPVPVYVKVGGPTPAGCTGNVEEPGAEKGHLCVFAALESNVGQLSICQSAQPIVQCLVGPGGAVDPAGFIMSALDEKAGAVIMNGTWAVTAE